jgi:hypothetical protein
VLWRRRRNRTSFSEEIFTCGAPAAAAAALPRDTRLLVDFAPPPLLESGWGVVVPLFLDFLGAM